MATPVIIKLSDEAMDELQRCTNHEERGRRLVSFIDEEIVKVQSWMRQNLGDEFAKFELAAIRTYLYRSITGELDGVGDIMDLPQVVQDHPSSLEN